MTNKEYLNIARKMGFIKHQPQIYNMKCNRTGLQGVAMYLLDEIESINKRRESKGVLDEYELMKNFFDGMKQFYK